MHIPWWQYMDAEGRQSTWLYLLNARGLVKGKARLILLTSLRMLTWLRIGFDALSAVDVLCFRHQHNRNNCCPMSRTL